MSITAPTTTMTVGNLIDGEERGALSGATFEKHNPATGEVRSLVARSDRRDVDAAAALFQDSEVETNAFVIWMASAAEQA